MPQVHWRTDDDRVFVGEVTEEEIQNHLQDLEVANELGVIATAIKWLGIVAIAGFPLCVMLYTACT